MKKNWIDIKKLESTLGVKYKETPFYVEIGSKKRSYCFELKAKDSKFEPVKLYISPEIPEAVFLQVRIFNKFLSTINFYKITEVRFVPENRKAIFISFLKDTFSVLEVYGYGMFDLDQGLDKKIYKDSKWAH